MDDLLFSDICESILSYLQLSMLVTTTGNISTMSTSTTCLCRHLVALKTKDMSKADGISCEGKGDLAQWSKPTTMLIYSAGVLMIWYYWIESFID